MLTCFVSLKSLVDTSLSDNALSLFSYPILIFDIITTFSYLHCFFNRVAIKVTNNFPIQVTREKVILITFFISANSLCGNKYSSIVSFFSFIILTVPNLFDKEFEVYLITFAPSNSSGIKILSSAS
jgi:hypothetical protein